MRGSTHGRSEPQSELRIPETFLKEQPFRWLLNPVSNHAEQPLSNRRATIENLGATVEQPREKPCFAPPYRGRENGCSVAASVYEGAGSYIYEDRAGLIGRQAPALTQAQPMLSSKPPFCPQHRHQHAGSRRSHPSSAERRPDMEKRISGIRLRSIPQRAPSKPLLSGGPKAPPPAVRRANCARTAGRITVAAAKLKSARCRSFVRSRPGIHYHERYGPAPPPFDTG